MSLTKLSLGGNNEVKYKLFLPRESLVSVIPAGDGNIANLFLQCGVIWETQEIFVEKGINLQVEHGYTTQYLQVLDIWLIATCDAALIKIHLEAFNIGTAGLFSPNFRLVNYWYLQTSNLFHFTLKLPLFFI